MKPLNLADVTAYVEQNIGTFHARRLEKLEPLQLHELLKHKNPYLFKAKGVGTAQDFVKIILDAYLSSQEETIFGDFLEGLAIFICAQVFAGRKSFVEGIDLEFDRDGVLYCVAIKSGPNWGNSSQVKRMRQNFSQAQRIYRTNNARQQQVLMVNGCCYGRDNKIDKGDYLKYCGQRFWELISGDENLYVDLIEPLGHQAKERNERFMQLYDQVVNRFVMQFMQDYFAGDVIDWPKLIQLASATEPPRKKTIKGSPLHLISLCSPAPIIPRIMGLVQVHVNLAIAVMLFNTLLGLWGFLKFFRGDGMDGNYFGAVALSPVLGLVQLVMGLILVSMGLGVNVRFVHYLYGALVIISVPSVFAFTRGRDDRGAVLIYAAMLLLTAAFGFRAYTTGFEASFATGL